MPYIPPADSSGGEPSRRNDEAREGFESFEKLFTGPQGTAVPEEPGVAAPEEPGVAAPENGSVEPSAPATRLQPQPQSRREARELALNAANVRSRPQGPKNAAGAVPPRGRSDRREAAPPEPRRRRSLRPLWITLIVVAVLAGIGGGGYALFEPQVEKLVSAAQERFAPNDYTGSGSGSVTVTIKEGDTGSDIANTLAADGVTKTSDAFYQLLLSSPDTNFQPGAYQLAKRMSATAALSALQDPKNKVEVKAVIPEGTAEKDALPIVAKATGISLADLTKAAADVSSYGVPAQAKTLEGFLFPATYQFTPGISAHDVIKTLVDRSFQSLDEAGVAPADRWKTIVLASVVQREAGLAPDYPKVSRVFLNRIARGWDLQSDATVAYGTGHTDTVTTTDAERANASNPYNTYQHPGLPVGPISNPGDLAIDAAIHPATGPWMYFVTWNLKTGETIFSTTLAEHDAAVAKWQKWMKDNPGYG